MKTSNLATRSAAMGATFVCTILTALSVQAATTTADAFDLQDQVGSGVRVSFPTPGTVTVSVPGGFPGPAGVTCVAQSTVANTSFAGDYVRAGVTTVAFSLVAMGDGIAGNSRVILTASSGREWARRGLTAANSISTERVAGGWTLAYASGDEDLDAAWAADLKSVTSIGVRILRNANTASYTLSNFHLIGSRTVGAAAPYPTDPTGDADRDGMSNLDEYRAENEAGFFEANLFKSASVTANADGSITIKFAVKDGGTYDVMRAKKVNPSEPGEAYEPLGSVVADGSGYAEYTDTTPGNGPNFYQIVQQ